MIEFNSFLNDLKPVVLENTFTTTLSNKIYQECKSYLDHGMNRSLLFCGPPGSGKSHIIKSICFKLGLKTLKISIKELKSEYTINIINLLQPEVLAIDDIDHGIESNDDGFDKILNTMEHNNQNVKLILASANVVTKLNPALQRPGRFDELIELNSLDHEIHHKLVDGDEELYRFTAHFPAAYIVEFMKRVKVKGKDTALRESNDLLVRVGNFKNFNYDLRVKEPCPDNGVTIN